MNAEVMILPVWTGLLRKVETHMVWNVKIVIGQSDTIPTHLVDQVLSDNDNLLAAVLNPVREICIITLCVCMVLTKTIQNHM